MNIIAQSTEFTIKVDSIEQQDTTDMCTTLLIETKDEEFEFTFAYGNLINFVRCKK